MNDLQAIGAGVLGFGAIFFIIGIISMMSREFLFTGNILIIIGVNLYMGPKGFFQFIIQKQKLKGTIAFSLGLGLIGFKLQLPGVISEIVGAYWLFGGFIPLFVGLLSKVPLISKILPSKQKDDVII